LHTDLSFISNAHGKEQIIVEKKLLCVVEKSIKNIVLNAS